MSQPASSLQPPRPRVGAPAWIQPISLALIALMMAMVLGYVIYLRYAIEQRINDAFGGQPTAEPSASCYDPTTQNRAARRRSALLLISSSTQPGPRLHPRASPGSRSRERRAIGGGGGVPSRCEPAGHPPYQPLLSPTEVR